MSRRQPVKTEVPHPRADSRLRWAVLACGGLLAVAAAWGWYVQMEPRWLYRDAAECFERNPRMAASLLEAAVHQSGGQYPDAQLLWARALLRLDQQVEAAGCFSLIEHRERLAADDLLQLASEARQAGALLLTSLALEAVPEPSPRFIEAREQLQRLRLDEGRFLEVLSLGHSLAAAQPERPLPYFLMAQASEQLTDPIAALAGYRTSLQQTVQLPPELRQIALRRIIRITLQTGAFDEARHWSDELRKSAKPTPDDRLAEAELLRATGEANAAWSLVSQLASESPANPAILELRGTLAMERNDPSAAEADFRQVLRVQPWNKGVHYKLAQLLQRTSRESEAESHFRENRRLTRLSVRLLALQQRKESDPARERARLNELADIYSELGQSRLAEQLRAQVP